MEQNRPVLIATEFQQKSPILVLDKKGVIGNALVTVLREQFLTVFVSGKDVEPQKNLVHIPYHRKIPKIPDEPYAPIFVVYNGEEEVMDMLPAFVKKAERANSRVFFITSLAQSSERLFKVLSHDYYRNVSVIVCGEIFDNSLPEINTVNFFIHQARLYGRIEIPDAGLGKLYPVSLQDVVVAVIATAFSLESKRQTLLVFSKHPFAEFTVVRIMQKLDPTLKIDFRKQRSEHPQYYIPPDGVYAFHEYELEDRLRQIDFSRREYKTPLPPQKKLRLPKQMRKKGGPFLYISIFLLVLFLPLIMTLLLTGGGLYQFKTAMTAAEQGNFNSAKQTMTQSQQAFEAADVFSNGILFFPLIARDQTALLRQTIMTGKNVSNTGQDLLDVITTLQKVFAGKSTDPQDDFLHATATLKNSFITLQKMEAESQLPEQVQKKFANTQELIAFLENTSDTWSAILGFEGTRNYLLLFQNNMELRPGGGFIGSYGMLGIENGKIDNFKI